VPDRIWCGDFFNSQEGARPSPPLKRSLGPAVAHASAAGHFSLFGPEDAQ
jgi:hypothetical protein